MFLLDIFLFRKYIKLYVLAGHFLLSFLFLNISSNAYATVPVNDDFSSAITLIGASGTVSGTTIDATVEPGEPDHAGYGSNSIWYSWTAPSSTTFQFNTVGSDFDTVLAVYSGDNLNNLSEVGHNDDAIGLTSLVSFAAQAGVTYYIAVDGFSTWTGNVVLSWEEGSGTDTITISGTISLPAGHIAPAGGLTFFVVAEGANYDSYYYNVFIPEGSSSSSYSFDLPEGLGDYTLYYDGFGGLPSQYLYFGYYSTNGTMIYWYDSTYLSGTESHFDVNLEVLTGKTISGTVFLPNGNVAPVGGICFDVEVDDENWNYSQWKSYCINEGESSTNYTLTIPDGSSINYIVYYNNYLLNQYVGGNGYYSATGTSFNYSDALPLAGDVDHSGIDLYFIAGNTISGTIHLPSGDVAPADGLYVDAWVDDSDHNSFYSTYGYLNPGESSVSYSVTVPEYQDASWLVSYHYWDYWGDSLYYPSGYYVSPTETTSNESYATILAGGRNYSTIDLTLLGSVTLSGALTIPDNGMLSSPANYTVTWQSDDGNYNDSDSGVFPAGVNSINYTLSVPENVGLVTVGFNLSDLSTGAYQTDGYYHSGGTVHTRSEAEHIEVISSKMSGLDMTLLKNKFINGLVLLPSGGIASQPINVVLGSLDYGSFYDTTMGLYDTTRVIIQSGENSALYTLYHPESSDTQRVGFVQDDNNYVRRGYYSQLGTMGRATTAEPLDGMQDYSNIDMEFMTGSVFSGTVSLPAGTVAEHDIPITLGTTLTSGDLYDTTTFYDTTVFINQGESQAFFDLRVAPDVGNFNLGYRVNESGMGARAYYRSSGPRLITCDQPSADQLDPSYGQTGFDLFLYHPGGDYNCDGLVDLQDVVLGLQIMSGKMPLDTVTPGADINQDGYLNFTEILFDFQDMAGQQ